MKARENDKNQSGKSATNRFPVLSYCGTLVLKGTCVRDILQLLNDSNATGEQPGDLITQSSD